jgi:hypothetical protein
VTKKNQKQSSERLKKIKSKVWRLKKLEGGVGPWCSFLSSLIPFLLLISSQHPPPLSLSLISCTHRTLVLPCTSMVKEPRQVGGEGGGGAHSVAEDQVHQGHHRQQIQLQELQCTWCQGWPDLPVLGVGGGGGSSTAAPTGSSKTAPAQAPPRRRRLLQGGADSSKATPAWPDNGGLGSGLDGSRSGLMRFFFKINLYTG